MFNAWFYGWHWWSVALVQTQILACEISQQLLDGLASDFVQTFMVLRGLSLIPLVISFPLVPP